MHMSPESGIEPSRTTTSKERALAVKRNAGRAKARAARERRLRRIAKIARWVAQAERIGLPLPAHYGAISSK